jgi:hypothetical protein
VRSCTNKLTEISSAETCSADLSRMNDSSDLIRELHQMLSMKNGFYTFESALQVFPCCAEPEHMNLHRWNDAATWKSAFGEFLNPYLCFAQDVFGEQFAILGADVIGFNPESRRACLAAGSTSERTTYHD